MQESPYPALNTREFIAKWHSAVEKQLVSELSDILPQLTAAPGRSDLSAEQSMSLAHHVAYALQVAGSPSGGIQAALSYLKQATGSPGEVPQPSGASQ